MNKPVPDSSTPANSLALSAPQPEQTQDAAANNLYTDTRGLSSQPRPFSEVIVQGLASGGGLFVPKTRPRLSVNQIASLGRLPYYQQAALLFQAWGVDFSFDQIQTAMALAYSENFDTPEIAPLVQVEPATWILELFHGPTAAFKDLALQCLPLFFTAAIQRQAAASAAIPYYLLLVATSGDTGSAAQMGFQDHEHTGVIVFFPASGTSDLQRRQMTSAPGKNVGAVAVRGNFDDCQTSIKAIFNDADFNATLAHQNVLLSSANSINWGRLLPQVVYYVSAYARLLAQGALRPGELLDVCVPTGNFGNILAAWYAKAIGTPLGQLFCASNENHVLTDFLNSGTYDIQDRPFQRTPSPSMDILVSSNLERQLFELNGRDPQRIRQWMTDLRDQRRFQVDKDTFAALRANYSADWVSNADSLATIRAVFNEWNYLLDPHTAVAWQVAERLRPTPRRPLLVVSTAHWAKFGVDVYRALHELRPEQALPDSVAALDGLQLIQQIQQETAAGPLPPALAALERRPIRFDQSSGSQPAELRRLIDAWLREHVL